MSDPIQLTQYIQSLGLSGEAARQKRAELQKLSAAELSALISGAQKEVKWSEAIAPGGFYLKGGAPLNANPDHQSPFSPMGWTSSTPQTSAEKKYTAAEKTELRNFAAQYLLDSATKAHSAIETYNKSVGIISTDAIVNGFKIFTGQEDRHSLEQKRNEELQQAQNLYSSLSQPGAFEAKFERQRGVLYNPENIDKLKEKSEEYLQITAIHEKYQTLQTGTKEIKAILRKEQEYQQSLKHLKGASAATLQPPKPSSHERFGQMLLEFCNNDKNLVNEYMSQLTTQMGSKAEIEKNLPKILEELQSNYKQEYTKKLNGKTYEQYTKEYENTYKKALGGTNPETETQNYITNAKMAAGFTEMGIVIASSFLLPGTSSFTKGATALTKKLGAQTASQIIQGTMTVTTAALPTTLTALSAATSETGFTAEKTEEMLEKLKSGLMYGGFAAYVSGPLGNSVTNILKANPQLMTTTLSKAFPNLSKMQTATANTLGTGVETSADVLFDLLTSEMSIKESLETNGGMNFAMMLAGGKIAKVQQYLSGIKVEQSSNGAFKVKDENGKLVLNTNDENVLGAFILGKAAEVADKTKFEVPEVVIPKKTLTDLYPETDASALEEMKTRLQNYAHGTENIELNEAEILQKAQNLMSPHVHITPFQHLS